MIYMHMMCDMTQVRVGDVVQQMEEVDVSWHLVQL